MVKKLIPDVQGEETGLMGVKTPNGRNQDGDIRDRLTKRGIDRFTQRFEKVATPAVEAEADNAAGQPVVPDYPGADKGLLGVKSPASWRQTDDIHDRLVAGGVYRMLPTLKNDKI